MGRRKRKSPPRIPTATKILGTSANVRPPSTRQLERLDALAALAGTKIKRPPRNEAEAYEWIGELAGRIEKARQ